MRPFIPPCFLSVAHHELRTWLGWAGWRSCKVGAPPAGQRPPLRGKWEVFSGGFIRTHHSYPQNKSWIFMTSLDENGQDELNKEITAKGSEVRDLKSSGGSKDSISKVRMRN
jgi:hypothetical protein